MRPNSIFLTPGTIAVPALGAQAMFAYDDGTAVDLPVRNEKEFLQFLDMLKNDQSVNGEYDILLLPAGGWNR